MSISKAQIKRRATKGAAFLDEKNPGWCKKIKLEELELANGDHCVLGQLYGTYVKGGELLFSTSLEDEGFGKLNHHGSRYGFFTSTHSSLDDNHQVYDILQEQWIKEIQKRCG